MAVWVSGTTDVGNETAPRVLGVGPQEGTLIVSVPAPAADGAQVRVFLNAALADADKANRPFVFNERKILELVLEPQARRPSAARPAPSFSIVNGQVNLEPVSADRATELLKARAPSKDVDVRIETVLPSTQPGASP